MACGLVVELSRKRLPNTSWLGLGIAGSGRISLHGNACDTTWIMLTKLRPADCCPPPGRLMEGWTSTNRPNVHALENDGNGLASWAASQRRWKPGIATSHSDLENHNYNSSETGCRVCLILFQAVGSVRKC
eukprot:1047125-Amphidinium_carterae.1